MRIPWSWALVAIVVVALRSTVKVAKFKTRLAKWAQRVETLTQPQDKIFTKRRSAGACRALARVSITSHQVTFITKEMLQYIVVRSRNPRYVKHLLSSEYC